jgi:SAM-dependent methyltransferase
MQNDWDARYARQEFIYGTKPNQFIEQQLVNLSQKGSILFPAEGEGRNACYAASLGWKVFAFDQSSEARKKALMLAQNQNTEIMYDVQDFENWIPMANQFDCVALIFVHLPENLRKATHQHVIRALKPGGTLLLEAFTINQLSRTSGGPKTEALLYTKEILASDFKDLNISLLQETQTQLDEGPLHQGIADVVRVIATKSM